MQSVSGDDFPGQIERGEQRGERRDLVAFGLDLALSDDELVVVQGRGEQMNGRAVGAAAAQGLAIDRDGDRRKVAGVFGGQPGEVAARRLVQGVAVQAGQ
nr:hypothetical protein [Actinocorallia herbida]